ncbi:RDD family protein [Streptomyces sp. NBC_01178]|uniref:RDD family protein n=1 Tax=Streptomyces sp. NBC_01178 TaxID=2903762 RepID=UPI0038697899|nr:RDD family protein [Streptomyces sp. NBC_01178]
MSAPTPAPGDESPREGYYPDPSIPGYVRYWNGASWVPGTSRPAPAASAPETGAPTAPVEETGPIFFDEEEAARREGPDGAAPDDSGEPAGRPGEPASVWQADTARQTGFGGDRDRRVDWGGPNREPAGPPAPSAGPPALPADPRAPLAQAPAGGVLPGTGDGGGGPAAGKAAGTRPPSEGTITIRAAGARPEAARDGGAPGPGAVRPDAPQPGPVPPTAGPGAPQGPQNLSAARHSLAPAPVPRALPAQAGPMPHQPPPVQASQARPNPSAQPAQPAHQAQLPPQLQQAQRSSQPSPQRVPQSPQPQAYAPAQQAHLPRAAAPGGPAAPAPAPADLVRAPSTGPGAAPPTPSASGPAGGPASWAHQVPGPDRVAPQLPPPGAGQPVVPWKPPVDDPFQQLARDQASARPAGLGKRFAARLVDNLVLGAVVGAAAIPLTVRALDHIDRKITAAKETGQTVTVWLLDSTTGTLLGALLAAFLFLGFLLEALPTAKWGRTLGKKLFGLDVRDIESHETPSLGAALRRWLVYGVLGLLVLGVVNVLWCLFDRPWRQCWHDKAARTFVAG